MLGVAGSGTEKAEDKWHYRGYENETLRKGEAAGDEGKADSGSVGVNVVKIDARSKRQGREATLAGLAAIAKEFDVEEEVDDKENEDREGKTEEEDDDNMFSYL